MNADLTGQGPTDRESAWLLLHDSRTDAAALARIAAEYPEFAAAIAQHPNCYDGLRTWADAYVASASVEQPAPAEAEVQSRSLGETDVGPRRQSPRRWIFIGAGAAVLVAVVAIAGVSVWSMQGGLADARESFTAAVADYRQLDAQLQSEVEALGGGVESAEAAGLGGESVESAKAAVAAVATASPRLEVSGDDWNDAAVIQDALAEVNRGIESIRARLIEVTAKRTQLETETSGVLRDAAVAVLTSALDEAQRTYDSSAGRVSDEAPREGLQRSIESARSLLSEPATAANRLRQDAESLAGAVTAVNTVLLPRWEDISGVWCPTAQGWDGCREIDLSHRYQSGYERMEGVTLSPSESSGDGVHGCFLGGLWPGDDLIGYGSAAHVLLCPAGTVSNNFHPSVPEDTRYDRLYIFQGQDIEPWYRHGDYEAATGHSPP